MNSTELSICIPTYNREKYLKQLLDCILDQLKDINENVVEICVSDNASTDNTQQMLQQYQQQYNNITYFRWDKNMGADMNYLKVVEIAHGKYCWFFGSDDLMVDGAIKQMLKEIKENHDIYLCNRYQCDINMNIMSKYNLLQNKINTTVFNFNGYDTILKYLKTVYHMEGFFSYLSSIIFKKEQWNSVETDKSFIGTAYSLTYKFLKILKKNITVKYIKDYLVLYRGTNDSLASEGAVKRLKLDFDGYQKLFIAVFPENKNLKNYYKIIFKKFYPTYIIAGVYEKVNKKDRQELLKLVEENYNIVTIKTISLFYSFYRKIIKKLIGTTLHKKIIITLFYK